MNEAASQFIFIGLILAIFYFMLIRPQRRRVQAHQQLVRSVEVGDEVVTAGGILGTIRSVQEDTFEVEVAPGTTMRFLKTSISRRVTEDDAIDDEEDVAIDEATDADEDDIGRTGAP